MDDPLFILGAFLIGGAAGYVQGYIKGCAKFEKDFTLLKERVHQAEETVNELEKQEGPKIEARILERIYRQ